MINLEIYKNYVRSMIGVEGVKTLTPDEWREFTEYARSIVELNNDGEEQISANGGNMDWKDLIDLHQSFNFATTRFTGQLTFGRDQHDKPVSFEKLHGELRSAHPAILPGLCARFIHLWSIEHKLNMKYRELLGAKKKQFTTATLHDRGEFIQN